MAIHHSLDAVAGVAKGRLEELLSDGESVVFIAHPTPWIIPETIHRYLSYYVVTDRRFIHLKQTARYDNITDVRLADISRIEAEPQHIREKTELTLSAPGVHEEYTLVEALGEPLADALRDQLARKPDVA